MRHAPFARRARRDHLQPAGASVSGLGQPDDLDRRLAATGDTKALPLTARHVLTLTAGAAPERVDVAVNPLAPLTITGATVDPVTSTTGPSLTTCPGRWNRMRNAYREVSPPQGRATFTIAAGQTATVTADVTLVNRPLDEETLDAESILDLAQGRPFVMSSAVDGFYDGPLAVDLDFRVLRAADGSYVIRGRR